MNRGNPFPDAESDGGVGLIWVFCTRLRRVDAPASPRSPALTQCAGPTHKPRPPPMAARGPAAPTPARGSPENGKERSVDAAQTAVGKGSKRPLPPLPSPSAIPTVSIVAPTTSAARDPRPACFHRIAPVLRPPQCDSSARPTALGREVPSRIASGFRAGTRSPKSWNEGGAAAAAS